VILETFILSYINKMIVIVKVVSLLVGKSIG